MLTEEDLIRIYEEVKPNIYASDYDRIKDYGMNDLLKAIKEKLRNSNRCTCWKCQGFKKDPYEEDEE